VEGAIATMPNKRLGKVQQTWTNPMGFIVIEFQQKTVTQFIFPNNGPGP